MIDSALPASGAGSSWRRTRSGATASRGRISMAARSSSRPHIAAGSAGERVPRRSGSSAGHPNGPVSDADTGSASSVGDSLRRGTGPRLRARRLTRSSALLRPRQAKMRNGSSSKASAKQEIDRRDVLAGVLPVGTRALGRRTRAAEAGNSEPADSANASSISSGMSPARSFAMKTALDSITASAASHSAAGEDLRPDRHAVRRRPRALDRRHHVAWCDLHADHLTGAGVMLASLQPAADAHRLEHRDEPLRPPGVTDPAALAPRQQAAFDGDRLRGWWPPSAARSVDGRGWRRRGGISRLPWRRPTRRRRRGSARSTSR